MKRYEDIDMEDTQTWSNQAVFFTRQLWNMLVLARGLRLGHIIVMNHVAPIINQNSQSVMTKSG